MKRQTYILILSLALSLAGCGKKSDNTSLISSHTTVSRETMSPTANAPESAPTSETQAAEGSKAPAASHGNADTKKGEAAAGITASIKTYTAGNVSVEYPELSNLTAPASGLSGLQEEINRQLRDYALNVIKAYGADSDKGSLAIRCKVLSVNRRRITAVYTGTYTMPDSARPFNIFYTNTINTATGQVMGLTDYTDSYTLAGYVLSNDCQFVNVDAGLRKELLKLKNELNIHTYTDMFNRADFPYKAPEDTDEEPNAADFPQVFSFESNGTIYVSIPVSHALGDYALIAYTPESK